MIWILLACSTSEKETGNQSSVFAYDWQTLDYKETGPYQVGHRQVEHTYTPLADQPERTIVIEIWYPTEDTSGATAEYLYGVDEAVYKSAEPAPPIYEQGYPVHVHSHGYRGWGATSAFLMRHFASHGWVVAAPNHTNNLLGDHQDPLPVSHFVHRAMDIQQSLDVLSTVELAGAINTSEVVMSGHSFGASYTTWASSGASYDNIEAVCTEGEGLADPEMRCSESEYAAFSSGELRDQRVKVAVPLAGTVRETFFGEEGYKEVHAPILFVSGTEDGESGNQSHYDAIEDIDFRWLSVLGGCHQSFATGACDSLDMELGFDIQNAYILGFARQRLLGDNSSEVEQLLSGELQLWEEATLLEK